MGLKVLLHTPNFLPKVSGETLSVYNIARGLTSIGHEVTVVTRYSALKGFRDYGVLRRVNFEVVYTLNGTQLVYEMLRRSYDLIHCFYLVFPGVRGLIVKHVKRLPLIVTTMGYDIHYLKRVGVYGEMSVWKYLELVNLSRVVVKLSDAIVALNNYDKEFLKTMGADEVKVYVVPHPIDTERFSPEFRRYRDEVLENLGIDPGHVLVLTVARFLRFKGWHLLVRAIPLVVKKVKDIHFVFVGTGERPWVEEHVKALGLKNVKILTNVSPDVLPLLYASCDIYVQPSLIETGPLTVLEALSSGLPVIGSPTGWIPLYVKDYRTGFIVNPFNTSELAEKIVLLAQDERLRRRMGIEARTVAIKEFSIRAVAIKYSKIYSYVLARS